MNRTRSRATPRPSLNKCVKQKSSGPTTAAWKYLDSALRLRLADLDSKRFEDFFLHFLNSGVELTVQRKGKAVTRRVIRAETYAAGGGKNQKGIDLRVTVEGDEVWCIQCKRHKKWTRAETKAAIKKAAKFKAQHYILAVSCDPLSDVHDEVALHANWTLWNLDNICAEFRLRVPSHKQAQILNFVGFAPVEIKRFVGLATRALVTPREFFSRFLGAEKSFRHDWKLVGREAQMKALQDFLSDDTKKVLTLVSKGGDGKSRLLWEFTRDLEQKVTGAQVLFFNPHSNDAPDFAFLSDATLRVLVIDDAHRTESVPSSVLALAACDPQSKIILAMRPQGLPALSQKLFEVGLASVQTSLPLSQLKKAAVKDLAQQALGVDLEEHASALVHLTADCPFLTVLAGDLLRRGILRWGGWASDQEFRQHVFRAFETENLQHVRDTQREIARGLLRLAALLAPCTLNSEWIEKAARCLSITPYEVETLLQHLQRTELIASSSNGVRIVPDLFADFLVYDACFEPSAKMPVFVQRILSEFRDTSAELLRNLAEAAWIAQVNNVTDSSLLKPLVDAQQKRFKGASFWERTQMLKHWGTFGVYLPSETIVLVRLAISLITAPPDTGMTGLMSEGELDSHRHVLEQLPQLLEPVARFHKDHRTEALDLLWELGSLMTWYRIINNQNHPFSVVGELLTFGPRTSIPSVLQTLAWLERKLRLPGNLVPLEGKVPVLHTLLRPCFARFVGFQERDGRTLHWWEQPVSLDHTASIRGHALRIVKWVIQHGSWLAALDALSVAAEAIRRIAPMDISKVKNPEEFRKLWRPERLKALAAYELAINAQNHVAIRFEVRATLLRDIFYEEDAEFANACRRILALIPDDLSLRTSIAILSHGNFDFEHEVATPRTEAGRERARELWKQHVAAVARELVAAYPNADDLFRFLHQLGLDFVAADKHPFYEALFAELARNAAPVALGLGKRILAHNGATPLARAWVMLISESPSLTSRPELLRDSIYSKCEGVRAATVCSLTRLPRDDRPLNAPEEAVLVAIAQDANADEARALLQFIEWAGTSNIQFAYRLLDGMRLDEHATLLLESIFEALVPHEARPIPPSLVTVEKVLAQLVRVPRIDTYNHGREWDFLCDKYPKTIYDFVARRIEWSLSGRRTKVFNPIPQGYRDTFDLPGLKEDAEFHQICDELWKRVDDPEVKGSFHWLRAFQAVVLNDRSNWVPRLLQAIASANSIERLSWLVHLIDFDGSLLIFREPDVIRSLLQRANDIGGGDGLKEIRRALYASCGPKTRSYSGGELDKEDDYVEAEASKAATLHQNDCILGPFYKWIVEAEQRDRAWNKARIEADMAAEE